MATYEQIYQATRRHGLSHDDAEREARTYADRASAPAPATPPQPAPPRELPMPLSDGHMRAFDQQIQRGVQEQAEDQRDWAELQRIDAELKTLTAPLRQRRVALAARIDRRRAH